MNIVFFGSSHFGLPSLKALLNSGHNISCVVTQPDRKKGRHLHITKTIIKEFAEKSGISIYQPDRVNTPLAINFLKKLNPDLFVAIAYGQILSGELLNITAIMPINVHASLLPFYRGAAPINWAIINAETETGITVIKMTARMDAGPIMLQKKINITDDDTFITLENKLSLMAAQSLLESLDLISNKKYALTPQDESKVTFAPKLKKADGLINWSKSAGNIHNLIKGCLGWPDAFTYYNGKLLKIFRAKVCQFVNKFSCSACRLPGKILEASTNGIFVATGKDILIIEELQLEGKRKMKVDEFIAGHKISCRESLGK